MQKVEISKDKPLQPGDIIEIHFKTVGGTWVKASHLAIIEYRLAGRSDFEIRSWSIPDDHSLYFEILIKKTNPVAVTAAIIGAVIIGTGVIAWLTFDKVYQIMDSPAGQVGVAGFGVFAIVAAIVIILGLLQKK